MCCAFGWVQVHMTGRLSLPTLNCLGGALVWLRENSGQVFDRLRVGHPHPEQKYH